MTIITILVIIVNIVSVGTEGRRSSKNPIKMFLTILNKSFFTHY